MGCPPVQGDNRRALASRLSYVQVDNHDITILYHLHQCRHTHHEIFRAKVGKGGKSNSYTMACPPVHGDNPRALASGLSYVQVDKHGITIYNYISEDLAHHAIFCAKVGKGGTSNSYTVGCPPVRGDN